MFLIYSLSDDLLSKAKYHNRDSRLKQNKDGIDIYKYKGEDENGIQCTSHLFYGYE